MTNGQRSWLVGAGLMGIWLAAGPAYAEKICSSKRTERGCPAESIGSVVCTTTYAAACDAAKLSRCKVTANAGISTLDATLQAIGSNRAGLDNGHATQRLDQLEATARQSIVALKATIAGHDEGVGKQLTQHGQATAELTTKREERAEAKRELAELARSNKPISAAEAWLDCQRAAVADLISATTGLKTLPSPAQAALLVTENQRLLYRACFSVLATPPIPVPPGAQLGPLDACAFRIETSDPVSRLDNPIFFAREQAHRASERVCRTLDTRWRERLAALKANGPLDPAGLDRDLEDLVGLEMPDPGAAPRPTPPSAAANHAAVEAVLTARTAYTAAKRQLEERAKRANTRIARLETDLGTINQKIAELRQKIAVLRTRIDEIVDEQAVYRRDRSTVNGGQATLRGLQLCDDAHCTCVKGETECKGECERLWRDKFMRGGEGGQR